MTTQAPQLVPRVWTDEPIPRRRVLLWEQEGRKCHWCGEPTRMVNDNSWDKATTEHIIPRHRGGTNDPENLVSACNRCNNRRNHEDHLGLPEGSLLGEYKRNGVKPRATNRIVLTGDEKKAILARVAAIPLKKTAEETLREQRDQLLATNFELRKQLQHTEGLVKDQAHRLKNVTVWWVIRRDLLEWLRSIGNNDGA